MIRLICRVVIKRSEYKPPHLESNTYKWTLNTFGYCCYYLLIKRSVAFFFLHSHFLSFYFKLYSPVSPSFYIVNIMITVNRLQKCLPSCQSYPPKKLLKCASSSSGTPLKILKTDQKYNSWKIADFQWWGLIIHGLIWEVSLEFIRKWRKKNPDLVRPCSLHDYL